MCVYNVHVLFPLGFVCQSCECKISEMVEFLYADREHMQQGVFPDVQQSYLLHSALNFDEVSLDFANS